MLSYILQLQYKSPHSTDLDNVKNRGEEEEKGKENEEGREEEMKKGKEHEEERENEGEEIQRRERAHVHLCCDLNRTTMCAQLIQLGVLAL